MKKDEKKDQKKHEEVEQPEQQEQEDPCEELKEKAKEWEDKCKRALADYQNLEKRVRTEKQEWAKIANKDVLLRLLPVLDTLMLAQQHSEDQSLKISVSQFLDVLKSEGVTKIEVVGHEFDPAIMEVIDTVEVDPSAGSGQGENKVIAEVRPGFMIHDRLLRAAHVRVGKKS
ncbi:MAG: nucleotide exchange factor GrpE [Candidatus Levybacteria bacterium]|nr:nucleotide exchange factor GrpE [Candidatus Levybacteria bacterium]